MAIRSPSGSIQPPPHPLREDSAAFHAVHIADTAVSTDARGDFAKACSLFFDASDWLTIALEGNYLQYCCTQKK